MKRRIPYLPICLAAALSVPAVAQDDDGGGFLERKLEELLSGEGRDVSITGFEGALSSRATLETMTFSDADGVWLSLSDVSLEWTRTALLRGRLEVNELTAAEIDFARPPLPSNELPTAEAPGFSLPELPVSVNIGTISAERLSLGEPLIGVAADLRIDGTLSLADGEGSGRIAAERIDGVEGSYIVEGNYANATRVLTVNASVNEAPGGIVATLAGLPGEPALDLSIAGTGPLDDFGADLTLATDGVDRVTGSLEVLAVGEGGNDTGFNLRLAGDVAPLVFPDYQAFFGPDLSLAVDGTKRGDGSLRISTLSLEAAQLSLSGSAEIGADGLPDVIDLDGRIAAADGTPVLLPQSGPPVRIDSADLRVGFDASRSEDWTAVIDVSGLSRPGFSAESLRLDGDGRISGGDVPRVTADLDFTASALDLGDPDAEAALGEDVSGHVAVDWRGGEPVELTDLGIDGETYGLTGRATIDTSDDGVEIDAEARVSARDLSVFSGLAGRDLAGAVEADVTAEVAPIAGRYDITVKATGSDLGTGMAEVDQLLEGDAAVDLAVRRDETGSHVDRLIADTDAARVNATASLTSERGEVRAEATLIRTDVIAPGVAGPLRLKLEADGPPDLWDIVATMDGPGTALSSDATLDLRVDVPSVSGAVTAALEELAPYAPRIGREVSGAVTLTANGSLATDLSRFDLTANAESRDLAIGQPGVDDLLAGLARTSVSASREGDTIRIPRFTFESTAGRAEVTEASIDLSGAAPALSGALTAALDDIAPFGTLAGRDLSGAAQVEASGSLTTDLADFDVTADLVTRDLAIGQAQADRILEGRADSRVVARREADTVTVSDFSFRSAQLTADASGDVQIGASLAEVRSGTGTATVRLLSADGILPGMPVPLTAKLDVDGDPEAVDLDLSVDGEALTVSADTRLSLADAVPSVSGTADVAATDISPFSELAGRPLSGAIELSADGSVGLDLEAFDLTAAAETRNLSIGQPDVDALLAGDGTAALRATRAEGIIEVERLEVETAALNVSANGSTGRDSNSAEFDLRVADVGRWVPGFSGAATAEGTASQEGGGDWQLDVSATAPGGTRADVTGSAAPSFDDFDVSATGSLPLQLANSFIDPRAVAGTARFDLRLDGPPALGSVSGRIETSGAQFTAPTLNLRLRDLGATVDIAGSTARIDSGARVAAGGRLAASGSVGLAAPFPADLGITLSNVAFSDPALYRTRVDGSVQIEGGLAGGALIFGGIQLGETEIQIPSGSTGAVGPSVSVEHVNEPADVRRTRQRAGLVSGPGASSPDNGQSAGPAFPLRLTISAPRRIFVRGRGLEAELGGELTLGGTTADVIPSGQFELIRGRLDILGQRLTFDEGSASLQGDFNPFLDFVASTQKEDTLVRVIVQGPAAEPEIGFESEPSLPEDEVVAQLLFGRSIDSLSPLQAAQLAAAVATLAGRGGNDIIGRLRQDFGLDDLDVTGDSDGGVGVRAGKYISDNIYSDVTVDSEGEAEVSINLDLSDSVTVRGSVGSEGNTGVGIFFERDY